MKLTFLLVISFFYNLTFAQNAEPTKEETRKWIKSKLLMYGMNMDYIKIDDDNSYGWHSMITNSANIPESEIDKLKQSTITNLIISNNKTLTWFNLSEIDIHSFLLETLNDDIKLTFTSNTDRDISCYLLKGSRADGVFYCTQQGAIIFDGSKLANPNDPNIMERFIKAFKRLIILSGGKDVDEKY